MRLVVCAVAVALAALGSSASASTSRAPHIRVLRLVDRTRVAHFRNGASGPRVLVTVVRYPRSGTPPFPLVVFGHGFALSPANYARLLDRWAEAGYVVAAPIFPVENRAAPGGADETDLVNEPGDFRFVISRLTAPGSPVEALIDAREVAIAGQSDGAEAALSAAYDLRYRTRGVRAALILSGAALPGFSPAATGAPALLAVQGTGDTTNAPANTSYYFRLVHRPRFLLWLLGASHLAPYTTRDRWAATVGDATVAFLDHYLRGAPLSGLLDVGRRSTLVKLVSDP